MLKKYGKKYDDVAILKRDFITDNKEHLRENDRIAELYKRQPRRKNCKICGESIEKIDFTSHGIDYTICTCCGHVNGAYIETADFTRLIYESENYGKNYKEEEEENYWQRVEKIYVPKADFMCSVLEQEEDYLQLKYLDVGAGSGYYVAAMNKAGLRAKGIEVSPFQVEYGNRMQGMGCLDCVGENDIPEFLRKSKADVLSFIGVLEHIINLDDVLEAIHENKSIKYIYYSVPMFSFSVMWESISKRVFNRHLGGMHTHIFSDRSREFLHEKYGWETLGEWRFGTDIPDLFRTVLVELALNDNYTLSRIFEAKMGPLIDEIQCIIDKNEFASEIHCLCRKKD